MSALLDNLPDDWKFITLGDLNTQKAPTLRPKDFPNETFEYYSIPDYQRDQHPSFIKGTEIGSSKLLLKPRTVLFGKLNPRVEKVWRVSQSSEHRQIGSTEWIAILPDNRVDTNFLYFLELSDHVMPIAKTFVSGTTPSRQRVDPTSFYRLRVPIPPLPEQKKIAHILSTVQRAIEAQERIIQTTTELKKTLMRKLFTEGLRNEPQKQTEIGPIPESWEVRKLGDIAMTISKGSSPKWQGFKYTKSGILFVRSQNVGIGKMLFEERVYLPAEFNEKEKRSILQSGDILINLVGASIGRVALGTHGIEGGNCNQAVCFVRLDSSEFLKQLIVYFLLSPWGQEQMRRQKKDIARANISLLDVKGFDIPLPPTEEEIKEVASALVTLEEKAIMHERKRDQLQDLFYTFLHKLMTAKMRVHKINILE